jgi:hypothetical protein
MKGPSSPIYAVSVKSSTRPCLLCRIRRAPSGIYMLIPRDNPHQDMHVSYHTRGMHHIKSYGTKIFPTPSQPLGEHFCGAVSLFAYAIPPGDETKYTRSWQPEKFTRVFELGPEHFIGLGTHTLTVDLVEPNHAALPGPWREQIWQESIRDAVPWILITLWRGISI